MGWSSQHGLENIKIFPTHHGFSLRRDHVIKDVVNKVMSPNTNFDEIVV